MKHLFVVGLIGLALSGCSLGESTRRVENRTISLSNQLTTVYQGGYDGDLVYTFNRQPTPPNPPLVLVYPELNEQQLEVKSQESPSDSAFLISSPDPSRAVLAVPAASFSHGFLCRALLAGHSGPTHNILATCYDDIVRSQLDQAVSEGPVRPIIRDHSLPSDLAPTHHLLWRLSELSPSGRTFSISLLKDGRLWRSCEINDSSTPMSCAATLSGSFSNWNSS